MCRDNIEAWERCDYCGEKFGDREDHVFSRTSPDGSIASTAGYLACLSCWEKEKSKDGE